MNVSNSDRVSGSDQTDMVTPVWLRVLVADMIADARSGAAMPANVIAEHIERHARADNHTSGSDTALPSIPASGDGPADTAELMARARYCRQWGNFDGFHRELFDELERQHARADVFTLAFTLATNAVFTILNELTSNGTQPARTPTGR